MPVGNYTKITSLLQISIRSVLQYHDNDKARKCMESFDVSLLCRFSYFEHIKLQLTHIKHRIFHPYSTTLHTLYDLVACNLFGLLCGAYARKFLIPFRSP